MTPFDHQLLASVLLNKQSNLQEAVTMKTITRIATGMALLITAGLAAVTIADRYEYTSVYGFRTAEVKAFAEPSPEYLKAVAAGMVYEGDEPSTTVEVAGQNPEASAR